MSASQYQQELSATGIGSDEGFYRSAYVHAVRTIRGIGYTQVVWWSRMYPVPYLRTMSAGRVVKTERDLEWLTTTHGGQQFQHNIGRDCHNIGAYIASRRRLYAD
jgi:hypothetical protein